GRARAPGVELLRRLAHAAQPRTGAHAALRAPAARRTDQPPRPRRDPVAGGVAEALPRHAHRHLPRPRLPRRRGHDRSAHRPAEAAPLLGRLLELRAPARPEPGARPGADREAAAPARAPA